MKQALVIKLSPLDNKSSAVIRTLALMNGLLDNGYKVCCVCLPLNHEVQDDERVRNVLSRAEMVYLPHGKAFDSFKRGQDLKKSGTKSFKLWIKEIIKSLYAKLVPFNHTISAATKLKLSQIPDLEYDIVISDSDPKSSHIAAKRLIKAGLKFKKWVQYWGDPLASDISGECILPKCCLKKLEHGLLSGADRIVYTSPFTVNEQKSMFPKLADKMVFCLTGCTIKNYEKTHNSRPLVSYVGDYMSKNRNIMPFYEALSKMENVQGIIKGNSDLELAPKENILIEERGNADKITADSDVLVCILNSQGGQIPGKIYHCAATNKKVVVVLDGTEKKRLQKFLESFHRFYICENTVDSISDSIVAALKDSREFLPLDSLDPAAAALKIIGESV